MHTHFGMNRAAWLAGALAMAACSPSTGTGPRSLGQTEGTGSGSSGNAGGAGSQTTGAGSSGSLVDTSAGGVMITITTTNIPSQDGPDGSCAGQTVGAERRTVTTQVPVTVEVNKPVAIFIMLDQSGSMIEPATPSGTKWSVVTSGISTFVNDPKSAGIDVALGFFPPLFPNPGNCDGTGYSTPTVPMGPLPANAAAITGALPGAPTGLSTPTEGGLRGAESYCETYQTSHPDEQCVVVFATDGQPSSCDTTLTDLEGVAGDAYKQGILTFAIGMAGANASEVDFGFLDALAVAGGTNCNPPNAGNEACDIGGGSDLTTALNTIRQTVTKTVYETKTETQTTKLACAFAVPDPPAGETFDPTKVNAIFSTSAGNQEIIYQAKTVADCANTTAKAWYFDPPDNPTQILLCPNTCSSINAGRGDGGLIEGDAGALPSVEVVFGCTTDYAPIH